MKLNEFDEINEGIMSNIASFTRGALGIPRPKDPRLMATDFVKRATDGIKLGIQQGKVAEPGSTPTANMPSISKWLEDFTSQYMGPSRDSAGIDVSGLQQVIKNAATSVENSYRQDQGRRALTALATTLHDTAAKSYAAPARNPSVAPTASQSTSTKAAVSPAAPKDVATYSIPVGMTSTDQSVKGPSGWVDAKTKSVPVTDPNQIKLLDRMLAAATPKKPKVNYADYQKQLAAQRAAKPEVTTESKQKIVKKWGEK